MGRIKFPFKSRYMDYVIEEMMNGGLLPGEREEIEQKRRISTGRTKGRLCGLESVEKESFISLNTFQHEL